MALENVFCLAVVLDGDSSFADVAGGEADGVLGLGDLEELADRVP